MVGVTLYWTFTYSGPYRYLAELQIKWLGYYVPKLTAMVIILGFVLIAGLIKLIFRGAERPVPGLPSAAPPTGTAPNSSMATVPQPWLRYARYLGPVIVLGIGGWAYFNGTQAGNLQELSALDFQNGSLHSRVVYADVRGHLSKTYLGKGHYLYIPMSSDTAGSTPVRLLVGVDENQTRKYLHKEDDGSFTVRGVADKGLEGDVKYAFEKNGIAVADPVWVVHTGRAPGDDRRIGIILAVIGIVFASLIYLWESYKKKKNAAAQPLQTLA
jgi:hypothetical protein